ncbi:tRNA adenosine(34) deaminase TadA [Paenalcaligenes sp. Me52]|uniref:tRNA adenosine(34) deaminase TadA n=1 Tax=Paenalcaligenes sp. Me52 TaxID=3392038 RepID=UPI00268908A9
MDLQNFGAEAEQRYMDRALELAMQAWACGEVPVGAVVVDIQGQIIGEGYNRTITTPDPTAHAEVVALRAAASKVGNYRLPGASVYVTLEPCVMCMGAMLHARVGRVVFAATDPKTGACGSVLCLQQHTQLNHQTIVEQGLRETEAADLLRRFFKERRAQQKAQRKSCDSESPTDSENV